jgi:outer membrane protein assembly factor BamB
MFRAGSARRGSSPESSITESNRSYLSGLFTAATGGDIWSSPAVAQGVVYVGSADHTLYAFDADGVTSCSAASVSNCAPLWTAATGDVVRSSPAVVNGVVYVGSNDAKLYAFDARGITGCSGSPKTCSPLWTAPGAGGLSSPAVAQGVVYVGSDDHNLYAFDANGETGCSGEPKTCTPLWTGPTGDVISSAPAVDPSRVYVSSNDGKLYAFDAAGVTGCAGSPNVCAPLWTATTGAALLSSPAVAKGIVYVGSDDHNLYAFDAEGLIGCSGSPTACEPLWSASTGDVVRSSPAVANGVVYVGSYDGVLYGFDAAGDTGCSGSPKVCNPVWSAATGGAIESSPALSDGVLYVGSDDDNLHAYAQSWSQDGFGAERTRYNHNEHRINTGNVSSLTRQWTGRIKSGFSQPIDSSPAVVNGVVYIGSQDHKLYAFDAAGNIGCSGTGKFCTPLWTGTTAGNVVSSPSVAKGVV